ncbi:uncharacterized [Tachysurus ichikawai]
MRRREERGIEERGGVTEGGQESRAFSSKETKANVADGQFPIDVDLFSSKWPLYCQGTKKMPVVVFSQAESP